MNCFCCVQVNSFAGVWKKFFCIHQKLNLIHKVCERSNSTAVPSCFLGLLLQRLVAEQKKTKIRLELWGRTHTRTNNKNLCVPDVVGRQRGRILALFGDFVVDETRGFVAALQAGVDAIEAQVERIAGQRVDVARVLAYGTARRAREAAIQFWQKFVPISATRMSFQVPQRCGKRLEALRSTFVIAINFGNMIILWYS